MVDRRGKHSHFFTGFGMGGGLGLAIIWLDCPAMGISALFLVYATIG